MKTFNSALIPTCLAVGILLAGSSISHAQPGDGIQDTLAAQIRMQGFACDKPLAAKQDTRRSKPDHAVWVLKCGNATYRVGRAPDIAAKVERLH